MADNWETLKASVKDDPEQLKEFLEIELRPIKRKQMFYGKERGSFINGEGEPVKEIKNLVRNNYQVRKEASKFIKDPDQLNKFMYARTIEDYLNKPFTKVAKNLGKDKPQYRNDILDNINKGRTGLDTIVYYNEEDAKKPRPQKTITPTADFKTPESEFQRVPEFLEENYKPKPDPDVSRGLGAILKVNKNAGDDGL